MSTRSDSEVDLGEPIEREGTETLLPSVTRSVLSTRKIPLVDPADLDEPAAPVVIAPELRDDALDDEVGPLAPAPDDDGVEPLPEQPPHASQVNPGGLPRRMTTTLLPILGGQVPVVPAPPVVPLTLDPEPPEPAEPPPDPDEHRATKLKLRDQVRGARTNDVIGGRYVVEGQLGRGGMGRVLRVRHQALGKPFALKLIKSAIATNPKIREMFYREARLASALTHDNICSIVDFGQDDSFGLFMVMELLDGQTVHTKLRSSGKLPPRVACDVMWQVADAVRFMHSRTILHGDIKTENIFLVRSTAQRRLVKLLDFGLARPDLGRVDGVDGTPEYVAPERIGGGAGASPASDIYALGIVFFELLTGKLPFTGDVRELFRQHREVPVPPPSKLTDDPLDERADALVARATAKDPAKRHPDVQAFMYELRALMGMLGIDGQPARRRAIATDATRERRDVNHHVKAAAEVFFAAALPMASCDPGGKVRVANRAFYEFIGAAGDAGGIELRDSALPEIYPTLFEDLQEVAARRRTIKRVIYLGEGGDRVVEAAVVLAAAPAASEVTAGEVHIMLHPLRVAKV